MSTAPTEPARRPSAADDDVNTSARTLCEAFQTTAGVDPDAVALRTADGTLEITWREYAERVRRIAAGLASLGVAPGYTVALMMGNRPEFHLCDTAAFHLGAIPYSIYNTLAADQIAHIFGNAGNSVVIAEEQYLERIRAARQDGEPATLVCIDGEPGDVMTLAELERRGAENTGFEFEAAWRAVEPGDVLTLIYTSGTTGPSKGVELTHANLLAECRAMAAVLPVRRGARITSYLPHAHAADRWASHYNSIVYGVQVTDVADARQVAAVLPQLKPTIWGAVPRVVEKIKAGLEAAIDGMPDEMRGPTRAAIETGLERVRLKDAGKPIPAELEQRYAQLDAAVLSKLRAKLGLDQAEWIIVGAAPLSRHVHEFLLAIGLPVTELYGMSECSCCVTVARPEDAKIGTVGPALPGVELATAQDGELLVRGDIVMRGYRNAPEKTRETIDAEGWVHTGDIAQIDSDGHVKIVDRKKELIINAAGKNMSPANIEAQLKIGSPLIGQAAVIGDRRPYNVALIVLEPEAAATFAREQALAETSSDELAANPEVRAAVQSGIERANAQLSRIEQIKRFELLADEWLPGGEELTPTMKLKRKPIAEKYASVIEALYA